ncbi:hypothetical protein EIP91_009407 [Steccherinum ochraceum]|uniref:F-box domain-containing protein n=1 Tax=Steccherinum ochraceum TaxID=92696 RepID=A0A4R0R4B6_9APHY|nr:hypothetical protein EIP91_009407 [Steccherinum ochraceum]
MGPNPTGIHPPAVYKKKSRMHAVVAPRSVPIPVLSSSPEAAVANLSGGKPIPPEIVDQIIGDLDKKSLSACTLVSRHWHNPAHYRLFRSIVVVDAPSSTDKAHGLAAFDSLVQSSQGYADVAQNIHELSIMGIAVQGEFPEDEEYCTTDTAHLGRILARLPALESLHLIGIRLKASIPSLQPSPKPLMKVHLDIIAFEATGWELNGAVAGPPSSAFTQLMSLFGHVQTLQMGPSTLWLSIPSSHLESRTQLSPMLQGHSPYGYYWSHPPSANEVAASLPKELLIDNILFRTNRQMELSMADFMLILAHGPHICRALQSVDIQDEVEVIHGLLLHLGPHLFHLRFHLDWYDDDKGLEDPFSISACTSLHALHVDVSAPSRGAWTPNVENTCLRKILLHLPSSVKKATVRFKRSQLFQHKTWSTEYIDGLDWGAIDEALSVRGSLEQLTFEISCARYVGEKPKFDDEVATIRDRLPKLVRKGMVVVLAVSDGDIAALVASSN